MYGKTMENVRNSINVRLVSNKKDCFYYDYIKNKYRDNSRLLFTDTDSLMYGIRTEDNSEDFSKDQ